MMNWNQLISDKRLGLGLEDCKFRNVGILALYFLNKE